MSSAGALKAEGGCRLRALAVDDSRTVRLILSKILVGLKFEVHEAADGREAFETLQKRSDYDLVLIDWYMPVMNGLELVQNSVGLGEDSLAQS